MIFVYHSNNKVHSVESDKNIDGHTERFISSCLFELAAEFPDQWLIWCDINYKYQINSDGLKSLLNNKFKMVSWGSLPSMKKEIGYIDTSPFINVKKNNLYPTWLMATEVGIIHAALLNNLKTYIKPAENFSYFLNVLSRSAMPLGLHCYHSSLLLSKEDAFGQFEYSSTLTFRFVKQTYGLKQVLKLFFLLFWFENRLVLLPFLKAMFYNKITLPDSITDEKHSTTNTHKSVGNSVDVLIPTLDRKKYLYDFLKDLSEQTHLPSNVIIVEQNPDPESHSELDYLKNEEWPFHIKHLFTHKTGACNARNRGLDEVSSKWVFLADDDIRVSKTFIEEVMSNSLMYDNNAFTISCLKPGEKENIKNRIQWSAFGSGCSFVKSEMIKNVRFDTAYEHGFGEDADFGMQLRKLGIDILYLPSPGITHLKAPKGGFRQKVEMPWEKQNPSPKPSPTIMLFFLKHKTKEQLKGYKLTLFFKFYFKQPIKNPFKYFKFFRKSWNQSLFWAQKLAINNKPLTNNH